MIIDKVDDKINFIKYLFCLEVTSITLKLPLGHEKFIGTLGYPIASKLKNYHMYNLLLIKNRY